MRSADQEAASQIALRDCSKAAVGKKSKYKALVKGEISAIKHSFYKRFLLVMRISCHRKGI